MIASLALTGDDLRIDDVWEVALHGAPIPIVEVTPDGSLRGPLDRE